MALILSGGRRRLGRRGSTLIETVIAMVVMTVAGMALIAMIQRAMIVALKAREQGTCGRMVQSGFSRLKNIDFYYLFAVDSASANFGLPSGHAYPYLATLAGLKATLAASRFDRFRVSVVFMRRDTSDSNANAMTSDLVAFADNGSGVDRFDSNIKYFDQNADGDYYETYVSGGRKIAEQPDTHIKQVALDVYRQGRLVCSQTELVSLEQFTGDVNPDSEAILSLLVSTPTNNVFLYQALSSAQTEGRALSIFNSYPSGVAQLRADSASALPIEGVTDPLADVNFYIGASGILASASADFSGVFSGGQSAVTAALAEGYNSFSAQAVKSTYKSPFTDRAFILDIKPPATSGPVPSGTVNTLAPFVAITLTDVGVSTIVTSGICPDVIALKIDGSTVSFKYNAATGQVVWIDSATETVPVVSSATYTASIEGGDYAGYKTSFTWTFTTSVSDTDNSAPSIANKSPSGMAGSDLPVISARVFDNQSGIVPLSIEMRLDGQVVVSAANLAGAYDASDGTVSYTPPSAFSPGSAHVVRITASHFSTEPADKVTSADTWGFSVP